MRKVFRSFVFIMTINSIKFWVLGLLLLLATFLPAQPGKQYATVAARKAFYMELASKYDSKGVAQILRSDTGNDFEAYLEGHTEAELLGSYGTVIHELLHAYNGQGFGLNSTYFTGPKVRMLVPMTKVFSSQELNTFVRLGLQDSIFRYGIYVAGKQAKARHGKETMLLNTGKANYVASISLGIYGLLEELNAYYFGTLAVWELFDYYQDIYGAETQVAWADYKADVLGNVVAYYEFRLFIAWYLMYAKREHADVYADLVHNLKLRRTFTLLEDRYRDLVDQVAAALPELDRLSGPGVEDLLNYTGSDEEVRAFFAENDIDVEEMGIAPGSAEWEAIRKEYLRAMGEMKAALGEKVDFFHGQAKAQIAFLKATFGPGEAKALANFRIK